MKRKALHHTTGARTGDALRMQEDNSPQQKSNSEQESDGEQEDDGQPQSGITRRWGLMLGSLIVFRVLNALLCSTSFVPDEYWQSLEVAHKMVFGYGYLTWEWQKAIRGYTHPLVFATLYKLLSCLHLDWPSLLVLLPRLVVQAPLAAAADYHVFKLASLFYGSNVGWYALLCNLASWFTFYSITRTLSNSTEAALTPVVFYYWLLATQTAGKSNAEAQKYTRIYLILMAVSMVMRPTGGVMWVPLVGIHLMKGRQHLWIVLREILAVGVLAFCWSLAVDSYFYEKVVVVQWKFLQFNVLEGHSALFGTSSWHRYFTQDAPSLLFTFLPLCLLGVWQSPHSTRTPFWMALWNIAVLSCLGHKEHRFLLPVLPIASLYAGYCMANWLQKYKHKVLRGLVWCLLLANVPMALYFSLVHQRGPTAVMDFLRKDVMAQSSVMFLMPCHSTPYYSHLHQKIHMQFLECPPSIDPDYQDVAEAFYSDPGGWLQSYYHTLPTAPPIPSHLVMYDVLIPAVHRFLISNEYQEMMGGISFVKSLHAAHQFNER